MMIFHLWEWVARDRGVGECEWMEIVYNNNSSGNSDDIRIQNVYCLLIFTLAWRFYIRLQNQIWWLRFNLLCHSFLQQQCRQCVDRVIVVAVIWKEKLIKRDGNEIVTRGWRRKFFSFNFMRVVVWIELQNFTGFKKLHLWDNQFLDN